MSAEEHIHYAPESSAVDNPAVLWSGFGALILLAGTIGGFYLIYDYALPIKTVPLPEQFAQPRVVTSQDEIAERQRLSAEQSRRLKAWGWADPAHTLVQIPIDRAMALLVQKGSDAYAPLLTPQPALSSPTAGALNAITPSKPAFNNPPQGKQP
jgi:hypothetical protein